MEDNNIFKIKMVNVSAILQALDELYGKGVDYVDISQEVGKEDVIIFSFTKEYIDEKYHKNFEDVPEAKKLTKEDLENLL